MATGLVAGYGALAAIAARFLYPARDSDRSWLYVIRIADMGVGDSLNYRTPAGARVVITRQGRTPEAESFLALSSTCPHLGCQVQWEPHNNRFFCPCHNGVFDPTGRAIEGPPAQAGQSLPNYPMKVESGLLFIEVAHSELHLGEGRVVPLPEKPPGPGHDPCLGCGNRRS